MNTWKVILATLVIFITGIVTGGLLVGYADRASQKNRRLPSRETFRSPVNPNSPIAANPRELSPRLPGLQSRLTRGLSADFLQRLDAQIHLTPEQRERIGKIILEGQQRNKEHWERLAPELRREMADTQKRIRKELTLEQRARFEELMKQSRPAGRRAEETLQPGARPRDPRELRRPPPTSDAPQPDAAPPSPQ